MTVRLLAWLNGLSLLLLGWLSMTLRRVPVATWEQAARVASVLAAGFCFIGLCVLLARRLPVVAKCMLATPLILVAAFLLGLTGAALVGAL